ncbi:protein translocase subunit SecF [Candidatus Pacearchaeota archaeon]|nr:protein translocase subunit SecF [Candidatus Pacearchaeota archaeon]
MEEQTENKISFKEKFGKFHDKYYKHMLILPIVIMLLCAFYLFSFYSKTGDFINKDISLTGGTSATIYGNFDSDKIKADLSGKFNEIETREIYDFATREKKAVIIETESSGTEVKKILEEYLGYELNGDNSSIEFTGPLLSKSFYNQLLFSVLIAFVLMGLVVFIMFRTFVPSAAIIISAFADIFMTLALVDILGIKISSAGIVAFLMLIGYSVDTDILLTNRVLKSSDGFLNGRIFGAFKTGMTMTLAAVASVAIALFISMSFSVVLAQIFSVLLMGLVFDILNTWVTNVSLIKWYALKNKI